MECSIETMACILEPHLPPRGSLTYVAVEELICAFLDCEEVDYMLRIKVRLVYGGIFRSRSEAFFRLQKVASRLRGSSTHTLERLPETSVTDGIERHGSAVDESAEHYKRQTSKPQSPETQGAAMMLPCSSSTPLNSSPKMPLEPRMQLESGIRPDTSTTNIPLTNPLQTRKRSLQTASKPPPKRPRAEFDPVLSPNYGVETTSAARARRSAPLAGVLESFPDRLEVVPVPPSDSGGDPPFQRIRVNLPKTASLEQTPMPQNSETLHIFGFNPAQTRKRSLSNAPLPFSKRLQSIVSDFKRPKQITTSVNYSRPTQIDQDKPNPAKDFSYLALP